MGEGMGIQRLIAMFLSRFCDAPVLTDTERPVILAVCYRIMPLPR